MATGITAVAPRETAMTEPRGALAPKKCSRCAGTVTSSDPARPEWITSRVFAPADPRPTMPSDTEIWWEIEADSATQGRITALLCASCCDLLTAWIYLGPVV